MGRIRHEIAQYRTYQNGVIHTVLNPKGLGAVRIQLLPPKWHPLSDAPYVLMLNGKYILPMGHSMATLVGNFMQEINRSDDGPMQEAKIQKAAHRAAVKTGKYYSMPLGETEADMDELLSMFYEVAERKRPGGKLGVRSLREYANYMAAPHGMNLMVSSMVDRDGRWNCSLKCKNCNAPEHRLTMTPQLTTQEWKRIMDNCKKAGICLVTFSGGEPTMRQDLPELVYNARWFVTRLNTNGARLTGDLCAKLFKASLDNVQITIYSDKECIHDKLVGADLPGTEGTWKKTVQGLRNALAAGLHVSVYTPLRRENAGYLGLLDFLYREGVHYVNCSGLIDTGKTAEEKPVTSELSVAEMDCLLEDAAAFCAEHGMKLRFMSPGRATPDVLRRLRLLVPTCGACLANMAILPDGSVIPCESWLGEDAVMGNMLTDNWDKIWHSEKCRKIREMKEEDAYCCPLHVPAEEPQTLS